jgi:hypothetical protein
MYATTLVGSLRFAQTFYVLYWQLRQYIDLESSEGPKRISLQDPGSIPEDTELLLIAGGKRIDTAAQFIQVHT